MLSAKEYQEINKELAEEKLKQENKERWERQVDNFISDLKIKEKKK